MPSYSRDSLKLFFLLALTFVSMGTLFTSPSISMKNPSMLTASSSTTGGGGSTQRFCMAPMKALKECEKKQSIILEEEEEKQCNDLNDRRLNVQKCDMIVKRAFRNINMSGCPNQIKFVTLCEDEWCHHTSSAADRKSCQKECAGVRESLNVCINQRMMKYFKWNGLQEDGTTMI